MENEVELLSKRMIRAIGNIRQFAERTYNFDSAKDFFAIHNFNIEGLKELSRLRKNNYYLEKLEEYPKLSENEVDYAIHKRTDGGGLSKQTEDKLQLLAEINKSILHVISHPGMDEMIRASE